MTNAYGAGRPLPRAFYVRPVSPCNLNRRAKLDAWDKRAGIAAGCPELEALRATRGPAHSVITRLPVSATDSSSTPARARNAGRTNRRSPAQSKQSNHYPNLSTERTTGPLCAGRTNHSRRLPHVAPFEWLIQRLEMGCTVRPGFSVWVYISPSWHACRRSILVRPRAPRKPPSSAGAHNRNDTVQYLDSRPESLPDTSGGPAALGHWRTPVRSLSLL